MEEGLSRHDNPSLSSRLSTLTSLEYFKTTIPIQTEPQSTAIVIATNHINHYCVMEIDLICNFIYLIALRALCGVHGRVKKSSTKVLSV